MGLEFASELSDTCLLHLAELPFAARQSVRDRYHVHAYRRFRDDIFIIQSDITDDIIENPSDGTCAQQ